MKFRKNYIEYKHKLRCESNHKNDTFMYELMENLLLGCTLLNNEILIVILRSYSV